MKDFKNGTLVKFNIKNRKQSLDGFAMGGILFLKSDEMTVYNKIDLELFPSCRDFKGKSCKVKHGDVGIILKKIGRPNKISSKSRWEMFDIYEILIGESFKGQMFKYNLCKI